jgi:hypothetical protein
MQGNAPQEQSNGLLTNMTHGESLVSTQKNFLISKRIDRL